MDKTENIPIDLALSILEHYVERADETGEYWETEPPDGDRITSRQAFERIKSMFTKLERRNVNVTAALVNWAHAAGWATGHGDTAADIVREMQSQHCDERSYADLAASGGLPEAQFYGGIPDCQCTTNAMPGENHNPRCPRWMETPDAD